MKNPFKWLFGRDKPVEITEPELQMPSYASRHTPDGQKITDGHGLQVVRFPTDYTQAVRLYGVSGNYAKLYSSQYNIRTAIDVIAREAAMLHVQVFEQDPRGKDKPVGEIPLRDHDLQILMDEPEPGMSKYRFWYSLFADIAVYDVAFWFKVRQNGKPAALLRIPPQNLTPDRDPVTSRVRGFRAPNHQYITRDQLVIFWGYDPATQEGYIPPMETLRRLIAEEVAAGMDREGRWRNSARKDGVIERAIGSPKMNDAAKEGFLLDVEDALGGPGGSGRPLMLQEGMTWNDVQWSPRELEYLESRKLSRTEVAAHFHMPPAMMAAAATGQEPDEKTLSFFYTSTLPSWLVRVEHEIEAQLLPEFEIVPARRRAIHVEFNLDEKLRGSFEERIGILATAAGGPIITVNEARARENLPPIEGGDLIFVPLNSVRAGGPQASPQNPTASPADGLEPAGITPGGGTTPQASLDDVNNGRAVVLGQKEAEAALNPGVETLEDLLDVVDGKHLAVRQAEAEYELFLKEHGAKYAALARQVFLNVFERQKRVTKTGRSLRLDRWNRELADDLLKYLYPKVGTIGEAAAKRSKSDFDLERVSALLRNKASETASETNDETVKLLESEDDAYSEERAEQLGQSISNWMLEWTQEKVRAQADEQSRRS